MKNLAKLVLLAIWAITLSGCQTDQEDHDFFYSGWRNPQEGANMRMYGTKKEPAEYGNHAGTPTDAMISQ